MCDVRCVWGGRGVGGCVGVCEVCVGESISASTGKC